MESPHGSTPLSPMLSRYQLTKTSVTDDKSTMDTTNFKSRSFLYYLKIS